MAPCASHGVDARRQWPIAETNASPFLSEVRRDDDMARRNADPGSLLRKPVWLLVEPAGTKNPWSG